MIYTLNPSKDTTIYENDITRNTGVDQILELQKHTVTPTVSGIKNSRVLMSFDLTKYNAAVSGVGVNKLDLQLWSANTRTIANDYILNFHTVPSADRNWGMGTGLLADNPAKTDGASWSLKNGVDAWAVEPDNSLTLYGSVTKS